MPVSGGRDHSKLDETDGLLEANLGLLKVDDVPDRGEILHEQIVSSSSCAGREI